MAELGEANIGGRMVPAWLLNLTAEELDSLKSRWYSNPNLLDNGYFVNPVNQRGQTSYPGAGYGIDRWKSGNSNLTVNLTGEGIVLISGSAASYLSQYFDPGIPSEGSYTISALVEAVAGTAYFQAIYADGTYGPAMKLTTGLNALAVKATKTISRVLFQVNAGASVTVKATKLELGSQQTLAHQDADGNWVLNEIPDYGEQLARCQRYFIKLTNVILNGMTNSGGTLAFGAIPLPVSMRAKPSVSSYIFSYCVAGGTKITSVSSAAVYGGNSDQSMFYVQFGVSGLPGDTNFAAYMNDIALTADL